MGDEALVANGRQGNRDPEEVIVVPRAAREVFVPKRLDQRLDRGISCGPTELHRSGAANLDRYLQWDRPAERPLLWTGEGPTACPQTRRLIANSCKLARPLLRISLAPE